MPSKLQQVEAVEHLSSIVRDQLEKVTTEYKTLLHDQTEQFASRRPCSARFKENANRIQVFAATAAIAAAISEIYSIYLRGRNHEKQNIWTPLLLMMVKYCYAFVFFCKVDPERDSKNKLYERLFLSDFTYFSKVLAFILWGSTFFMVMTVQITCSVNCSDKKKSKIDLALWHLVLVLVLTILVMTIVFWYITHRSERSTALMRPSMTLGMVSAIVIGIILGFFSSREIPT